MVVFPFGMTMRPTIRSVILSEAKNLSYAFIAANAALEEGCFGPEPWALSMTTNLTGRIVEIC